MNRVVIERQPELIQWLCDRIGYVPSPYMQAIGSIGADNFLHGVVGFDGFNGASCQMHVAGEPGWMNRTILKAAFVHAFDKLNCACVLGAVPSGNAEALRLNLHLGFKTVATIPGAHPDGSLIIMCMYRHECRWLALRVPLDKVVH